MKILILGASGLIGHTLVRELSYDFDVYGTLHKSKEFYPNSFFNSFSFISNIDVLSFDFLKGVVLAIKPNVILNCVGITKRKINHENICDLMNIAIYRIDEM